MHGRITYTSQDFLDYRVSSGGTVEIFDICVASNRRAGIGRWLVDQLIATVCDPHGIRRIWAITRASNFIAQAFYEALRFRVIAPLRDFYGLKDAEGRDTVDAIMYGRDLDAH